MDVYKYKYIYVIYYIFKLISWRLFSDDMNGISFIHRYHTEATESNDDQSPGLRTTPYSPNNSFCEDDGYANNVVFPIFFSETM